MSEQFDIAVLGAGPGGYVAALKAASMGARVALVEKGHFGGTCLNYGCIPSKALLASAELLHKIHDAAELGITISGEVNFDWTKIQKRKDKVLAKLRGGIKGLLKAREVKVYAGRAKLDGPGKVIVSDDKGNVESFTASKIIIATGSVPSVISGWPTDTNYVCTSDQALHWDKLPQSLLIVGGGVIGCEFACMMHEYGVKVTVVELLDNLIPEMETALGEALAGAFVKRGITIRTGVKVDSMAVNDGGVEAIINGEAARFDKVLVSTGRRPNTADLGLETVGLNTDRGFIRVNDNMETSVPGYYCIGDANGRCLLAHAASSHAVTAVENALGHNNTSVLPIPSAVYTFPEVASVGLTSKQAGRQGIPVVIGEFPIGALGKAMAVGEDFGFVRVISHKETGLLLGVHIIGHNATEIIESAAAMLTLKADTGRLAEMIFAHPTISEAVKEAAEDVFGHALHLPPKKITKIVAEIEEKK